MQTSLFLAKLIGPVLIVMGIAILIDSKRFQSLAREFIESEALIFLSGVITLPIGLAIVNTHNLWVMDWPVVITFCWLAIAAGIARMTIPGPLKKIGTAMIDNRSYFFCFQRRNDLTRRRPHLSGIFWLETFGRRVG